MLDASAAIELMLGTRAGRRLAERLARSPEPVCAPHVIDLEVAQVLRRMARGGQLTGQRARQVLARWRQWEIERYPHEPLLGRVWQLRENVSSCDAAYVALAEVLATVLVTSDGRLARALDGLPRPRFRVELI